MRTFLRILLVLLGLALLPAGLVGRWVDGVGDRGRAQIQSQLPGLVEKRLQQRPHYSAEKRQRVRVMAQRGWEIAQVLSAPPLFGGLLGAALVCFGVAVFGLRDSGPRRASRTH